MFRSVHTVYTGLNKVKTILFNIQSLLQLNLLRLYLLNFFLAPAFEL